MNTTTRSGTATALAASPLGLVLNAISLPPVPGKVRATLWMSLLILTAGVFVYPTRMTLPDSYQVVQTPSLYNHFPLFGLAYLAWIGILAYLLASSTEQRRPTWEQLALVVVFAFGFLYYWNVLTPGGKLWDEPFQLAHIEYLGKTGRIAPDHATLNYFNFPGIHLLGSIFGEVTQSDVFLVRDLLTLANVLAMSSLLYLLYRQALGQGRLAAFGTIVTLQFSPFYAKYPFFFPSTFALTLMIMALVFVYRESTTGRQVGGSMALLIAFAALTITHALTVAALVLALASMCLLGYLFGHAKIRPTLPLMLLVFALAWLIYVAVGFFEPVSRLASQTLQGLTTGENPFSFVTAMLGRGRRAAGGEAPLWAVLTVLWWTALIAIIVPLLWLRSFWRLWHGKAEDVRDVGGLLGIALLAVLAAISFPGGGGIGRYFLFAPILATPLLLRSLSSLSGRARPIAMWTLLVLTVFLSLPTFLVYNNSVTTDFTSAQEWAAARFAEDKIVGPRPQTTVYVASQMIGSPYTFYDHLLDAPKRLGGPSPDSVSDQDGYFEEIGTVVSEYLRQDQSLYVWSRKVGLMAEAYFGVSPSARPWQVVSEGLSNSNSIYDSGDMILYSHQ